MPSLCLALFSSPKVHFNASGAPLDSRDGAQDGLHKRLHPNSKICQSSDNTRSSVNDAADCEPGCLVFGIRQVPTYAVRMRKSSGGRLVLVLGLASGLVGACSSSSTGHPHAASGAEGSTAGASAHGGTIGAGGTSSVAGTAGKVVAGPGGASDGGTQDGASGDVAGSAGSGGAQNLYVVPIILGQGGGPASCLPRSLPVGLPGTADDGRIPCVIAELKPGSCDCSQTARAPLGSAMLSAMTRQLPLLGACGGDAGVGCDSFCGCEIVQAPGLANDQSSELYACQNQVSVAPSSNGFCLIDQNRRDGSGAPAPLGNPVLVAECPANQKRLLRFVGASTPEREAFAFLGCPGATNAD